MSGSSKGELFPRFSEKEYERRYKLVNVMMKQKKLDALLVYSPASNGTIHYLSNYMNAWRTYMIYEPDREMTIIVDFYNHIPCARQMSFVKDVQWHLNDPVKCVVDNLTKRRLAKSRIGMVGLNAVPYTEFVGIKGKLPNATFVDVNQDYSWIRWVRSEEEIEWFKKSAYLTDLTVEALEKQMRPGLTEHDLNAIAHEAYLHDGGQLWIDFISSTSMERPSVFVPWQYPTSRALRKGDVVITEITVGWWGYNSQIHRPYAVASEPTALYRKLYEAALDCFWNVSKALRPGATTKDIIKATNVIEERGFTVYDSLVHGEGAKNPELGSQSSIHPKEPFTFRENMVIVIQPQPITKDSRAGLQLGAATVVRPGGAESLHRYPFKFPVCGRD